MSTLVERVQAIGQRLISAQPRELAVGNIVRRVLGIIREEAEEDREGEINGQSDGNLESTKILGHSHRDVASSSSRQGKGGQVPQASVKADSRPSSFISHESYATKSAPTPDTSMFGLLSQPFTKAISPSATPDLQSPGYPNPLSKQTSSNQDAQDLKAEVIEGIQEVLDEINQADDQIAGYALEHIHSNETILTHSSSITVQRFLIKAAAKRKFTVIHAEAYPNHHEATHASVSGKGMAGRDDETTSDSFTKILTAAGITVVLIPDSATFALMSRVNKVLLSTHVVLADGSLVAAAGSKGIAKAARMHRTNLIVLCPVYQLSPVYPFDPDVFMEAGDPGKVIQATNGELMENVEVENPLVDYVPADLVDLYMTNM